MLAIQSVEAFSGTGVHKIITQCPQCFNVIKNGGGEMIHLLEGKKQG